LSSGEKVVFCFRNDWPTDIVGLTLSSTVTDKVFQCPRVAIWPFWNCLPEIKWFAIFWMLKKIVYFKACFEKLCTKIYNNLWNSNFESNYFNKLQKKIWLSLIIEDLTFFKFLIAKFGLFIFCTWQPCNAHHYFCCQLVWSLTDSDKKFIWLPSNLKTNNWAELSVLNNRTKDKKLYTC